MIHRLYPWFILFTITLTIPANTGAIVQTITAKDMAAAGITQVADIFRLAEGWEVNTTDGFSWNVVGRGLGTFQQPYLDVFIDNHKLDARLFDSVNLNLLGIALVQLDSVRLGTSPALVLGEITTGGYIHFFTSRRQSGWNLVGNINMGNETGDPGPWRYTNRATPNVDKIGPSSEIILARGNYNGQQVGTFVMQQYQFTDYALAPRTKKIDINWPYLFYVAPSLTIDQRFFGGWHQFRAAVGSGTRLYRWSEPLGFEAPTNLLTVDFGIGGYLPWSSRSVIQYRLNYASHELTETSITIPFGYDWHRRHLSGNLELANAGAGRTIKYGIGLDTHSLATQASLSASTYSVANVYASLSLVPDSRTGYQLAASVARAGSRTFLKAIASVDRQLSGKHHISLSTASVQRLPLAENSNLEWLRRGYDLYTWADLDNPWSAGQTEKTIPEFGPANQFSLDANWRFPTSNQTRFQLGLAYRRVTDLILEQRQIAYDSTTYFFAVANALTLDESYQVLGAHVSCTNRLMPDLHWYAEYRYWSVIASTDIAANQWKKIPLHKLAVSLFWQTAPTFSVSLAMTSVSPTAWPDYTNISLATYPFSNYHSIAYRDRVQSWINIDLHLRKQMWDRRLAASILLKNLLDQQVQYHPIGAIFRLTLFIKLELLLDQ